MELKFRILIWIKWLLDYDYYSRFNFAIIGIQFYFEFSGTINDFIEVDERINDKGRFDLCALTNLLTTAFHYEDLRFKGKIKKSATLAHCKFLSQMMITFAQ